MVRKVLLATGVALMLAPAAQAADLRVGEGGLSPYTWHAVWGTVFLDDQRGERNVVDARPPRDGLVRVRDGASALSLAVPGPATKGACIIGPLGHEATCTGVCAGDALTGTTVCDSPLLTGFVARLGTGDDSVVATGFAATSLDGGPGRDQLAGGDGDDLIGATDGEVDRIRCGGGHDFVFADAADVLLDGGCETVVRL